ncbi:MAG: superoxide dismutase family protein [Clostridia bacterium]
MLKKNMNMRVLKSFSIPNAIALIKGDAAHSNLKGEVCFYQDCMGVLVVSELWNLPFDPSKCANNIYAFHIHETGNCIDMMDSTFKKAGGHYNPGGCAHPAHSGDMPPLFANHGYSWQAFYTERFSVKEIIGRAVIIHERRDDFTTQPSGDSGARIGCGVIVAKAM